MNPIHILRRNDRRAGHAWKMGVTLAATLGLLATDALAAAKPPRPNILLIVADDMGSSDIGPYGGDVSTPTLDSLAHDGVTFTNFHTNATCSPTRSMLLSGVDNHLNGFGTMAGRLKNPPAANQVGKPGYEGYLNDKVVTIADLLRGNGYHTYMSGKWHMGGLDKNGNPIRPYQRGFEESFALIPGGDNHYVFAGSQNIPPSDELAQEYRENDVLVDRPADFYSTRNFTDKMIEYIDKNKADKKPFFGFLAYTAPHSPLQAPQEYIAKYLGKYDAGWDALRHDRFERQKAMGLIPANLPEPPRWSHIPAWTDSTPEQQAIDAKKMAVYAAMIDYMDMSIGRVVNHLKETGQYENTLIVFMSDNGPEGNNLMGSLEPLLEPAGFDNSLENIGNGSSSVSPAPGFAMVSNAAAFGAKASVAEGGIRNNFIASFPNGIEGGRRITSFASVLDVVPTLLNYAKAKYPDSFNGKPILPLNGRSMREVWAGRKDATHWVGEPIGVEIFGTVNKALFQDHYKILRLGDAPWGMGYAEQWKLFDLTTDPTEMIDLSADEPQRLNQMKRLYKRYEERVGFVPVIPPTPTPSANRTGETQVPTDADGHPLTLKQALEAAWDE